MVSEMCVRFGDGRWDTHIVKMFLLLLDLPVDLFPSLLISQEFVQILARLHCVRGRGTQRLQETENLLAILDTLLGVDFGDVATICLVGVQYLLARPPL